MKYWTKKELKARIDELKKQLAHLESLIKISELRWETGSQGSYKDTPIIDFKDEEFLNND